MDDKWFVFHEDGWVYFHRSWTGYCFYQLRFEQDESEVILREAWVNREYRSDDIEEQQLIRSLLVHLFSIGDEPCDK